MSAVITGRVFWTEFPELSYVEKNGKTINIKETTAKIVMLAIGDSADDYGENSWQSFETIAKKTSIQRRSVIRVVKALLSSEYLKLAGVSNYGTNNFSVNVQKLGNPPAKRSKNGRPKASDLITETSDPVTETSDPEAKTSDPKSPDPLINHADNRPITINGASIDWALGHDQPVTEQDLDTAKAIDEAPKMFEKAFGFGRLPWDSNAVWQKFRKFVTEIHIKDRMAFGSYVIWRGTDGKYNAMSNKQIRMNPQIFMDTGWMEFENRESKPTSSVSDLIRQMMEEPIYGNA